jgi:hypothetical protein
MRQMLCDKMLDGSVSCSHPGCKNPSCKTAGEDIYLHIHPESKILQDAFRNYSNKCDAVSAGVEGCPPGCRCVRISRSSRTAVPRVKEGLTTCEECLREENVRHMLIEI